jgi:hypothetical protein
MLSYKILEITLINGGGLNRATGIVPTYKTWVLVGENTNKGGKKITLINGGGLNRATGIVPTYKTGVLVGENTNKGGINNDT